MKSATRPKQCSNSARPRRLIFDPDRSLRKDLADIDQEVKTATETEADILISRLTLLVVRKAPAPLLAGIAQGAATTAPSPEPSPASSLPTFRRHDLRKKRRPQEVWQCPTAVSCAACRR